MINLRDGNLVKVSLTEVYPTVKAPSISKDENNIVV